jgi:hypothetical protein
MTSKIQLYLSVAICTGTAMMVCAVIMSAVEFLLP